MFAHFAELITAEQVDMFAICAQKESDVPLPTVWVIAGKYDYAATLRRVDRLSPLKPRPRESGAGARYANLCEAPIDE